MNRAVIISSAIILSSIGMAKASDKGFGIGIILGEPTGLSAKLWTSHQSAVDAAAAWSFFNKNSIHLSTDFLLHNFNLIKQALGRVPIYYGIGGRIKLVEDNQKDRIGIRLPLGLEYLPKRIPFDFFFEIVPLLDLVPATEFSVNGGIGLRYFFQ